jgi:hypothetical protein
MRGWATRLRAVILGRRVTRRQDKNWVAPAGRLRFGTLGACNIGRRVVRIDAGASSVSGTGGGLTPPSGPPGAQTGSQSITISAASDTTAPAPSPVAVQITVDRRYEGTFPGGGDER